MRTKISRAARRSFEVQMVNLRLRQAMLERGMTYSDLARRAGVSSAAVAGWATGHRSMSVETMMRLSEALGCSPTWLLTGKEYSLVDWPTQQVRRPRTQHGQLKKPVPLMNRLVARAGQLLALLKLLFIARDCH